MVRFKDSFFFWQSCFRFVCQEDCLKKSSKVRLIGTWWKSGCQTSFRQIPPKLSISFELYKKDNLQYVCRTSSRPLWMVISVCRLLHRFSQDWKISRTVWWIAIEPCAFKMLRGGIIWTGNSVEKTWLYLRESLSWAQWCSLLLHIKSMILEGANTSHLVPWVSFSVLHKHLDSIDLAVHWSWRDLVNLSSRYTLAVWTSQHPMRNYGQLQGGLSVTTSLRSYNGGSWRS